MPDIAAAAVIDKFARNMRLWFSDEAIGRMIIAAADDVGLAVLEKVGEEYPPAAPTGQEPSPLHTKKQWRWWWAMMHNIASKEGDVPESLRGWRASYRRVDGRKTIVINPGSHYKRTGTMVRSINYDVVKEGRGITITVGPTMARADGGDYARFVIGLPPPDGEQARIHQDRWIPLETLIADMDDKLFSVFMKSLNKELDKALGKTTKR